MIIKNSIKDYSHENIEEFANVAKEMNEKMMRANTIFIEEVAKPTASLGDPFYIDPTIIMEYQEMKDMELDFHEVLAVYQEWHERVLNLVLLNIGNYKNPALKQHVNQLLTICRTVTTVIKNSQN